MSTDPPLLGAHFSIAGGLENAVLSAEHLKCNVVQMFTKNARTWKEPVLDESKVRTFIRQRKHSRIRYLLSHASYLINIASDDPGKREQSVRSLASELCRSSRLGIEYLVLHPGAFLSSDAASGMERAARSLKQAFEEANVTSPRLLIETTAGQGTCLGHTFEQIATILEKTGNPGQTGVCMDTCHMYAAGLDISRPATYQAVMDEFDTLIGLDRLFAVHLNDSKASLGSKKDRHEHIGEGRIGITGFKLIMNDPRLKSVPKVLETPKEKNGKPMDPVNIKRLLDVISR